MGGGGGIRAMKQQYAKLSYTPVCQRHMVIATTLCVHGFALLQCSAPSQCRMLP